MAGERSVTFTLKLRSDELKSGSRDAKAALSDIGKAGEDAGKKASDGLGSAAKTTSTFSQAAEKAARSAAGLAAGNSEIAQAAARASVTMAAMSGTIGLIVAGTITLIAAYAKGQSQIDGFNRSLATSGNSAGKTAGDLAALTSQIGAQTGLYRDAETTLNKIASGGRLAGDGLVYAARAAVSLSAITGEAVGETITEFEKLADDPVKAVLKLNDQYHFLTLAVYDQIKALQDQGKEQAATDLALETAANAFEKRRVQIVENAGLIAQAFKEAKDFVLDLGDALANVGKDATTNSQLDALYAQRAVAQDKLNQLDNPSFGSFGSLLPNSLKVDKADQLIRETAAIDAQIAKLRDQQSAQDAVNKSASDQAQAEQARIKAAANIDSISASLDKQYAKQQAINQLNADFSKLVGSGDSRAVGVTSNGSGGFSGGLYDTLLGDINKKYAEHSTVARDAAKAEREFIAAQKDQNAALGALDSIISNATGKLDPLAHAWDKYSDALKQVVKEGGAAVADMGKLGDKGVSLAAIQAKVAQAIEAETAAYKRNVAAIQSKKEAMALLPYQKLQDDLGKYIEQLGKELETEQLRAAYGRDLTLVEEAELFIKEKLTDASGKMSAANKTEADTIRKLAAETQKLRDVEKLGNSLSDLFKAVTQNVANGQSAFEALGNAAVPVLGKISDQFMQIIKNNTNATTGVTDFGAAIDQMGVSIEKSLPALGQMLGTIAGGGGNGAATGAAVGAIIGGVIGSLIPVIGTYLGAAIGGFLGGIIGGQGDGNGTPRVYASSRPGSVSRDGNAPLQTPLGIIAIDTDNLADDAYKQFADTVRNFDIQLAKLFDPQQLDAVQNALENFSGKFSDINALLQARFDVILDAIGGSIKDFVNGFASDLQGRVQALADVLQLQKLEGSGDLIVESLDDALTLITEFSASGERVAETYNRLAVSTANYEGLLKLLGATFDGARIDLVRFAQNITDALGGIDRANQLWNDFTQGLYTPLELAASKVKTTSEDAAEKLTALGLSANISTEDFKAAFAKALPTLTPQQIALWVEAGAALGNATAAQRAYNEALADLVEQGRSLVDKLYGTGTLGGVNSEIDALTHKQEAWQNSIGNVSHAISTSIDTIRNSINLLLGDLSPLNDQQKLQTALSGLRAGTVTQEQVLEIGRRLYASSQAYVDLFHTVQSIGSRSGGGGNSGSFSNQGQKQVDRFTQDDQARLDDLIARRDQLAQEERSQNARSLADTVATLAVQQHQGYQDVANELHFNLADLAKDLGLTSDELTTYLDNLAKNQTAVPDSITANADRQIAAMYDIAGKQIPQFLLPPDYVNGTATNDSTYVTPTGHSGHVRPSNLAPIRGGSGGDTSGADNSAVIARLDTLIAETRAVNGSVVNAGAAQVLATRSVSQAVQQARTNAYRNIRQRA